MIQILVALGSVAFLCLWVAAWGLIATGSPRAAWKYLGTWVKVMGGTMAIAAVLLVIAWPLMPG